jgi:hypothetical protein
VYFELTGSHSQFGTGSAVRCLLCGQQPFAEHAGDLIKGITMIHTAIAPRRATRASVFTVATALAWLGHDCDGLCPALAICSPAELWFVPHPSSRHPSRQQSLIVVDVGDDSARAAEVRALLCEVNRCIGRRDIQVRERVPTVQSGAVVTRPSIEAIPDAALYLRRIDQPSNQGSSRPNQPEPTSAPFRGGHTAEARAMA